MPFKVIEVLNIVLLHVKSGVVSILKYKFNRVCKHCIFYIFFLNVMIKLLLFNYVFNYYWQNLSLV